MSAVPSESVSETPAPASSRRGTVRGTTKLFYALPSFVGAAMTIPVLVHMQPFYSDVVLLPVGYIALAIAVARSLDALTDPLIGWWSDRTVTRFGRRKPWMLGGVAACAVSFYLLFDPPVSLGLSEAATWFALTFATYFLFHTIYEIPYIGLGAELSSDYHERSGLFGLRSMMIGVGTIVAGAMPTVLDGAGIHDKRRAFHLMATGYVFLFVVLWGLCLLLVPEKKHDASQTTSPLVPGIRRALRNRPFRIFLAASIVYAIPSIIPALLMPYYVTYVLAPPDPLKWLGIFLVIYLGAGVLCVPLWVRLSYRFGKLPVWMVCNVIGVVGGALLFFAGKGDLRYVAWVQAFVGMQSGAFFFLGPAMIADITDYDELRTGKRREAQYMAFMTFVPKFVAIPGASIPLAILGALGYVPNHVQSAEVQTAIRTMFALVPACFNAAALFIVV
jgi:GPH family glycoside/pentoside/hexuronide:cation symporter